MIGQKLSAVSARTMAMEAIYQFTDNSSSFYPTSSYFGITDTAGYEKDIYYFYQSQWRSADDQPVLHLLPTWNLNEDQLDSKGNALVVYYTNAKSVELRAKKSVDDSIKII